MSVDLWICLDFEATCDEGELPEVRKDEAELIEFSYAIFDPAQNTILHTAQQYCKNDKTPLTAFCTQLTGITTETLANAGSLKDALSQLHALLRSTEFVGKQCCAIAHGSWDLEFLLPRNCKAAGIEVPHILQRYVDLRETAQSHLRVMRGVSSASSLAEICSALGVAMAGRQHCGLDDAKMVALATQALLKAGAPLVPIDLRTAYESFCIAGEKKLCLDGLPFTAVAGDLLSWMKGLGHDLREEGLLMVVESNGRPSGRGVVEFSSHDEALTALSSFDGGKLMQCGGYSRLVLLRPLRGSERECSNSGGPTLIKFPADADLVASMRSGCNVPVSTVRRYGDWICPTCQDLVFARNDVCRMCATSRPHGDVIPRGVAAMVKAKPGDWNCPSCQDLVFARNKACRRCGTQKPCR